MNISLPGIGLAVLLLLMPGFNLQRVTSLIAAAKGHGTFAISDTKQEIHSVVVVLREGGEAQITIITDLQLSTQGRWTASDDLSKGIDLEITGGIVTGNAKGTGRLFLRDDGKSIDRLNIEATSTTTKTLTIDFVADPKSTTAS